MLIELSNEFLKISKGNGQLTCELPFSPGYVVSDSIELRLSSPKLQVIAKKERPEGSYYFSFGIPNGVLDTPASKMTIGPQSNLVSVNLIYITGEGGFHSYEGASGSIEFTYSHATQRLEAKFGFKAIKGEVFEGVFDVSEFSMVTEAPMSTGVFSAVLPDPVLPREFEADRVELETYRPGAGLAFHGFNTTGYGREYAFALSLPSNMEVGISKTYDVAIYPNNEGKAMAGLIIGSNDGPINMYLGVSGAVEATYTPSNNRLEGKFFYMTIGGKKFTGKFDMRY